MHIISMAPLRRFWQQHADSEVPLKAWYKTIEKADFSNFAELHNTFNTVDKVGEYYVFNVHGNHVRVIAAIHFNRKKVFIRHVLTHVDYDKGNWKQ